MSESQKITLYNFLNANVAGSLSITRRKSVPCSEIEITMADFDIEELKVIIRSIVISSKTPISLFDLKRDFRESEGREIPVARMGYSNLRDFLSQALQDTVRVLSDDTVRALHSSETQHLEELIRKQRTTKKRTAKKSKFSRARGKSYSQFQYNWQKSSRPRNYSGGLSRTTPQYSGSKPKYTNISNPTNRYNNQNKSSNQYQSTSRWNTTQRESNNQRQQRNDQFGFGNSSSSSGDSFEVVTCAKENRDDLKINSSTVVEADVSMERIDYSSILTPQLKKNLRDIIKEHPEGVLCSQLSQLVREKYGVSLNYRKYGFSNMLELVDCIPEIIKIQNEDFQDWTLCDESHVSSVQALQKKEQAGVPVNICNKILEVSQSLSYPLTIEQFDKRYEIMNRRSLLEEVSGFETLEALLMTVDKSFVRLQNADGICTAMPFKKPRPGALDDDSNCDDVIDYPEHMLRLDGEVPRLETLSEALSPVMDVKLGEVYGPHRFFLISSYLNKSYENLDKNIQLFYAKSDHLALTGLPVKKGLYCVAPYVDKWHRAVITKVVNSTEVCVFLIDFGTSLKISKAELRFLHEDFSTIPKLAIRAALIDIAPLGKQEKFSREANIEFFKLTYNKVLKAHVKKVEFKGRKFLVRLEEIIGSESVFIDDQLVSAGLAQIATTSETASSIHSSSSEPARAFDQLLLTKICKNSEAAKINGLRSDPATVRESPSKNVSTNGEVKNTSNVALLRRFLSEKKEPVQRLDIPNLPVSPTKESCTNSEVPNTSTVALLRRFLVKNKEQVPNCDPPTVPVSPSQNVSSNGEVLNTSNVALLRRFLVEKKEPVQRLETPTIPVSPTKESGPAGEVAATSSVALLRRLLRANQLGER